MIGRRVATFVVALVLPALALAQAVRVERGSINQTVIERGELQPASAADVFCTVRGKTGTAIRWLIDDGALVKKGEKIAELDDSALRDQAKTQVVTLEQAEAKVKQAEADLVSAEAAARRDLDIAKGKLELAEFELKGPTDGVAGERRKLEIKVRQATINLEIAKRKRAGGKDPDLTAAEALAETDLELAELALKQFNENLTIARRKAELKLAEAARDLDLVKLQLEGLLNQAKTAVKSARVAVNLERDQLRNLEAEIQKCTIVAPMDGLAVYHVSDARFGAGAREIVAVGEMVREGQKLLRIADLTRMQVAVRVPEAQIALLKKDQPARVRVDALPNQPIIGKVAAIASVASPTVYLASDVKVYAVIVDLADTPDRLKPGMTAEVVVAVAEAKNVLRVPLTAVHVERGQAYCYVKSALGTQKRTVSLGLRDSRFVEVREGLMEGEEVTPKPMPPEIPDKGKGPAKGAAAPAPATVVVRSVKPDAEGGRTFVRTYGLTEKDATAFAAMAGVSRVVPVRTFAVEARRGERTFTGQLVATTPAQADVERWTVAAGRFLSDDDSDRSANIAVLGTDAAAALFPGEEPVGKTVVVGGLAFVVVGTLAAGTTGMGSIVVPFATARSRFGDTVVTRLGGARVAERVQVSRATLVLDDASRADAVRRMVGDYLKATHEAKDFEIQ